MFSLRKWGCCQSILLDLSFQLVFPTQVGVLLIELNLSSPRKGFPYASGGVAVARLYTQDTYAFSLRKWGCCRSL